MSQFKSPSQTVGSIVRGFESACTRYINTIRNTIGRRVWQQDYWEHIIRNELEYERIARYIVNNPNKWALDKLNNGIGNSVLEPQAPYDEEPWMV